MTKDYAPEMRDDETVELPPEDDDVTTTEHVPATDGGTSGEPPAGGVLDDLGDEIRRGVVTNGWDRAGFAALAGFVAVLAIGAILVLMAKLVLPGFGTGRSPLWMLARIGVAGLAALGAPISRGAETSSVLISGGVLFVGWMLSWATRKVVATSGAISARERIGEGLKVAIAFALLCLIGALAFNTGDGAPQLSVRPLGALAIGLLWGSVFGTLGALRAGGAGRFAPVSWLRERPLLRSGLRLGAAMLRNLALLAAVAVVAALVLKLVVGDVSGLGAGEAIAFLLSVILFFPNLVVGAAAFSLGAPFEVLARTVDSTSAISQTSLFGWGAATPGWLSYLLLLLPLAAFAYAAFHSHRLQHRAEVLGTAAGLVAVVATIAVWILRVEVGAAFLGHGQYLIAAAGAPATFVLAALWTMGAGGLGWRLSSGGSTKSE